MNEGYEDMAGYENSKTLGPDNLAMKYMQQVVLPCCTRSAFHRLQLQNERGRIHS